MFKEIEHSKITLSQKDEALIKFLKENLDLEENLSFDEYEKIITKHIQEIEAYVRKMMQESGYDPSQIDSVYLTGGTSLSKPIRNIFYHIFGKERVNEEDTFHSVAHGLSLNYL